MNRVRDYNEIVTRLNALPARDWRVEQTGEVWGYPFFRVKRTVARSAPTVYLTGGMHGEEPAGVEGVLRWLESGEAKRSRVNWLVLPCINPYGWERNQRRNKQRYDINRHFRNSDDCVEARLIKQLVRGQRFVFSIEFHEDVDASGYYLYELSRREPFIGEKILSAVGKIVRINPDSVIDGRPATGRGLIRRCPDIEQLKKRPQWPMAFHLFMKHTDHILGSETAARGGTLERRAEAHNVALRMALKHAL